MTHFYESGKKRCLVVCVCTCVLPEIEFHPDLSDGGQCDTNNTWTSALSGRNSGTECDSVRQEVSAVAHYSTVNKPFYFMDWSGVDEVKLTLTYVPFLRSSDQRAHLRDLQAQAVPLPLGGQWRQRLWTHRGRDQVSCWGEEAASHRRPPPVLPDRLGVDDKHSADRIQNTCRENYFLSWIFVFPAPPGALEHQVSQFWRCCQ